VDVDCCLLGIECYIGSERGDVRRYICEMCKYIIWSTLIYELRIGGKRKEVCYECYKKFEKFNNGR
jgi:RNase P subunit RPR2